MRGAVGAPDVDTRREQRGLAVGARRRLSEPTRSVAPTGEALWISVQLDPYENPERVAPVVPPLYDLGSGCCVLVLVELLLSTAEACW
jgi:hypothetical protein